MNKETLEEAAAKYGNINIPIPYGYVGSANDFINGAKWKKEQIILLIDKWKKYQCKYEEMADKCRNVDDSVNERRYTYKAQATRDCWKELLELINNK